MTPLAGPLRLTVVYPSASDVIDARDSTFLFGSVGDGRATLTVNGLAVAVWPNGAWLAWLPVAPDSILNFALVARLGEDSATLTYPVRRVPRFQPAPGRVVWIDSNSVSPASRAWWPAEEYLPLSVRAAEGASVRLLLPGGTVVPLAPDAGPADVAPGILAFDRDTANLAVPRRTDRYVGAIRGVALGASPGPLLGNASGEQAAPACCMAIPSPTRRAGEPPGGDSVMIEAIIGTDTARARWPLHLALLDSVSQLVEFNDDTASKGNTDSLTVGRTRPGATYHWFFPTGTRTVISGRLGDDLRVRLSHNQEAWVPVADALPLPAGTPATRGTVSSITLTPSSDRLALRIPISQRVPFRVEEGENQLVLRLYNSVSDVNWTRYGTADPYLRDIRWLQETADEVTITLQLQASVWGYRTRWVRNELVFEVRRPPLDRFAPPTSGSADRGRCGPPSRRCHWPNRAPGG